MKEHAVRIRRTTFWSFFDVFPLLEDGKGFFETGIQFHGKGDQVHQGRSAQRAQPSEESEQSKAGARLIKARTGVARMMSEPNFSIFVRAAPAGYAMQGDGTRMILHRMAHFVGGSGHGREGFPVHVTCGQPDSLRERVVMVSQLGFLDGTSRMSNCSSK